MKKSGITSGVLKRALLGSFGWALPLALSGLCYSTLLAQQPADQPSQTRSKTFVPSPSASERAAPTGQIKILEIEYSSRREEVPINEDKIRQNMRSTKGGVYSQEVVDSDIESLYATGDLSLIHI